MDEKGLIQLDAQRRTTDLTIYAMGDVVGEPMLAQKAAHEGRVVAEVIRGHSTAFHPWAIPVVVSTDPEIKWCGLTETCEGRKAFCGGMSIPVGSIWKGDNTVAKRCCYEVNSHSRN